MDISDDINILAFAGSTRDGSYSQQLVVDATEIAANLGVKVAIVRLDDYEIPIYSDRLEREGGLPEKAKQFRTLLKTHQAIIIATPEYNGSIPPVLKNLLDWTSRNEEAGYSSLFGDMPVALLSSSPGPGAGKAALQHLTDIIHSLGGKTTVNQTSIGRAYQYFAKEGRANETLLKQMEELVGLIPKKASKEELKASI